MQENNIMVSDILNTVHNMYDTIENIYNTYNIHDLVSITTSAARINIQRIGHTRGLSSTIMHQNLCIYKN